MVLREDAIAGQDSQCRMRKMTEDAVAADLAQSLAVLVSGGLDSAVLLAELLPSAARVCPLYVRFGLFWEAEELRYLEQFLAALAAPSLQPLVVLDMPARDLYGAHWSVTGAGIPDASTPDEAVFLPGRNVLLLAKAMLWCHMSGVSTLALAPLDSNPFPDATPEFFRDYAAIVNQAVGGAVRVVQPYRGLDKVAVLQRGRRLPLEWTFSCIRPCGGVHCGACNKCGERQRAFVAAGLSDPTVYARSPHV
jgi:7-cyano-7-deazaguanine synthase